MYSNIYTDETETAEAKQNPPNKSDYAPLKVKYQGSDVNFKLKR